MKKKSSAARRTVPTTEPTAIPATAPLLRPEEPLEPSLGLPSEEESAFLDRMSTTFSSAPSSHLQEDTLKVRRS